MQNQKLTIQNQKQLNELIELVKLKRDEREQTETMERDGRAHPHSKPVKLTNDLISRRVEGYRRHIEGILAQQIKGNGGSSLMSKHEQLIKISRVVRAISIADPLILERAYSLEELTNGKAIQDVEVEVEAMFNVIRMSLERFANNNMNAHMEIRGQTFAVPKMLRETSDANNTEQTSDDGLTRVNMLEWWKLRANRTMVQAYAKAVREYRPEGKTYEDILRIFKEVRNILKVVEEDHKRGGTDLEDARDELVHKLSGSLPNIRDHKEAIQAIDSRIEKGEDGIKSSTNAYHARAARLHKSELVPPPHLVRTTLCVDSGAFHTMTGNPEHFEPGSLKPLESGDEFINMSVSGPFENSDQMQVQGRGTLYTYVKIDDGGIGLPRYKKIVVKNALHVPECEDILLNPDDLMDPKKSSNNWEILWNSKHKILACDGFVLDRMPPQFKEDRSWIFYSTQTRPAKDQLVGTKKKAVMTQALRAEHMHRFFHATPEVMAKLPQAAEELPVGWDNTATYQGKCPTCAATALVDKRGTSSEKSRNENTQQVPNKPILKHVTFSENTDESPKQLSTNPLARLALSVRTRESTSTAPATVNVAGRTRRMSTKKMEAQLQVSQPKARESPDGPFRPRSDGTAVRDNERSMMDLHGPRSAAITGETMALLIVDEKSRFMSVRGLRRKSDFYRQFFVMMADQRRRRPKILRGDDDPLYTRDFVETLAKYDVSFEKTAPYTHNQIGLPERCFRTIGQKMDSLLLDANLHTDDFWFYAFMYSVSILNVMPRKDLNWKSPFELYYGRKPNLKNFKVFGSYIMVHVSKEVRLKGDMRHKEGIFLGFSQDSSGIVFLDLADKKISNCGFEKFKVVDDRTNFVPRQYDDKGPTPVITKAPGKGATPQKVNTGPNPELTKELFHWKTGTSTQNTTTGANDNTTPTSPQVEPSTYTTRPVHGTGTARLQAIKIRATQRKEAQRRQEERTKQERSRKTNVQAATMSTAARGAGTKASEAVSPKHKTSPKISKKRRDGEYVDTTGPTHKGRSQHDRVVRETYVGPQGQKTLFTQHYAPTPARVRRTRWISTKTHSNKEPTQCAKTCEGGYQVEFQMPEDVEAPVMHQVWQDLMAGKKPEHGVMTVLRIRNAVQRRVGPKGRRLKVRRVTHGTHPLERADEKGNPRLDTECPKSMEDLMANPRFKEQWIAAFKKEYDNLVGMDAFLDVRGELPKGTRVVPVLNVFELKFDADGNFRKFKVRQVLAGHRMLKQPAELTSAPCPRHTSLRTTVALAGFRGHWLYQFDCVSAYLQALLDEEKHGVVYIRIYNPHTQRYEVKRLLRNLYGSAIAGKNWNDLLTTTMVNKLGFKQPDLTEPCLFVGGERYTGTLTVLIHVDDGMCVVENKSDWDLFFSEFVKHFPATSDGLMTSNLGVKFEQTEEGIKMSQPAYIEKKLAEFGLENDPPKTLPATALNDLEERIKTAEADGTYKRIDSTKFLSMSSSLRHVQQLTRLDISFYVGVASSYQHKPNNIVYEYMEDIWRYLKGTKERGIFAARGKPEQELEVHAWSDSEFGHGVQYASAQDPDYAAPVAGGVVTLGTMPVQWWSKKLKTVCLSTSEAELKAAVETAKDIVEVDLLTKTMNEKLSIRPLLHLDSTTAREWIDHGSKSFARTRHLGVQYFWIIQQRRDGVFSTDYVDTKEMKADMLTKPLSKPMLSAHVGALMR